jgi:hypothetical protein
MIPFVLSYLVAAAIAQADVPVGTNAYTPPPGPCCLDGGVLMNDGLCHWLVEPVMQFVCNGEDVLISGENICIDQYAFDGKTPCKDDYVLETGADGMQICIRRYDARPEYCPSDYALNSQRMCEKVSESGCPSSEVSPSATPCLRICPASNQTFVSPSGAFSMFLQSQFLNGSCFYNVPVGSYAACDLKGELHPETNSCWYYYEIMSATSSCKDGYQMMQWNGRMICLKQTEVIYIACPYDYKLVEYMGQRMCIMEEDAICIEDSASPSMTPRVIEEPSMTPRVVEEPSMTPRVVEEPSMTPRVIQEPSRSPSMTPKIAERTMSSSMTPKVVEEASRSPSMTPKVAERTMSSSMTPKVVEEASRSPSMTPKGPERTMSSSMTPRPSNADVLDVTNGPVVIVATKKPDCNIWVCPKDYSVENVN